jgi:hypothetical protein
MMITHLAADDRRVLLRRGLHRLVEVDGGGARRQPPQARDDEEHEPAGGHGRARAGHHAVGAGSALRFSRERRALQVTTQPRSSLAYWQLDCEWR